jgi:fibronectin type 3 domain-containing protein
VDERSGVPTLAIGRAGGWPTALEALDEHARALIADEPELLGRWGDRLVLDEAASGPIGGRAWQVTFRQVIDGVPVEGARYDFHVAGGNLVAFGAAGLAPVTSSTTPNLSRDEARAVVDDYLGAEAALIVDLEEPGLRLVPVDPTGLDNVAWEGARGQGYGHLLVWRFTFAVPDEVPLWVAEVNAHTGEIVSFFDDARYQRIKGGIFNAANNGDCANDGCIQPDYPMPFLDYTVDGGAVQFTGDHGLYECSTIGAEIETTLIGQYVRVIDSCGTASETTYCEDELDLGLNAGTDCQVGDGSPGNTRAGRTSYYHLNVSKQRAREFLPGNAWLQARVNSRVNRNGNCNAVWTGSVNTFTSGGGCNNTGENTSVVVHEWGHGMDANDGGGSDNPSEAYADIVAFLHNRESCIGRGFRQSGNCGGYGDTCLNCTGVRDVDWDMRVNHTPATPSGFLTTNCPDGGGPCGKETHCEGYVGAEAVWDLATRDLPAMGLDPDTAWQLTDKLWYVSRLGSGGNAYNCSLPSSDGCGTNSWFHKLRLADDDDGDLNNGTPHAAAIFAAFDRHDIACGSSSAASNQDSSSCPTLAQPVLTSTLGLTNSAELTWDPVTDAASYTVLRNEMGCDRAQTIVGRLDDPATTFIDDDLSNDFPVYYRVQAVGSNSACESAVSACIEVIPQPLAGKVRFDQAAYGCANRIGLSVRDANAVGPTITVTVRSDSEPTPEAVVLTEIGPGSDRFAGEIFTTSAAAAADGVLSVTPGDTLVAEYVDADDGTGGFDVVREHQAAVDCTFPVISDVLITNVTGSTATIVWDTDELADTVLRWDDLTPPAQIATGDARSTSHAIDLTGLQGCTPYFFEVESTDTAGNTAVDDAGGSFYRFETLGDLGNGLQLCHLGRVVVEQAAPSCSQTVTFRVSDVDLNEDPLVADTRVVLVSSTTETDPEPVVVTETGPDTSLFTGSIGSALGAPVPDGAIQAADGDIFTVTYADDDDGQGSPVVTFGTAVFDCHGPAITDLRVETITNSRLAVRWTTDEPADSVVWWGDTPALGQTTSSGASVTDHSVILNQFSTCQEGYLRVGSTDVLGNAAVVDDHGSPFRISTWEIPGLYWMDDFENGTNGWTLNGEWEIGTPLGNGGSSGLADPAAAYNNAAVLGHDLSGLGAFGGDYEPGISETALSPTLNATTWTDTELIIHRKLSTGDSDSAGLSLKVGPLTVPYFTTDGAATSDSDFVIETYNVGVFADGKPAISVQFSQSSDGTGQYSGWNVDDVIFKDSTLPDYAACGGCATGPGFAGAVTAIDNDACGASGVTVSWDRAVSWGTGSDGTYAVHRDTVPGFTPSGANLVASGLTGLSYNDATAPNDQTLYYVVLAENDETCGSGPANGGLTEGQSAVAEVQETTSVPVPGEVPGLTVDLVADTHVRLQWGAAADATGYRVYRSTSPQPGTFSQLAESDAFVFEDVGEGATASSFYYTVIGINACGQESP